MSKTEEPQAHQQRTKACYDMHGSQGPPQKQAARRGYSRARADAAGGILVDIGGSAPASRALPPPRAPPGAQGVEFVPSIGNVHVFIDDKHLIHVQGRSIPPDVYPRTPDGQLPLNFRRSYKFDGPMPYIRRPSHTAIGITPRYLKDYTCKLQELKDERSRNPFENDKDFALEGRF